jgi:hypothetical protein
VNEIDGQVAAAGFDLSDAARQEYRARWHSLETGAALEQAVAF